MTMTDTPHQKFQLVRFVLPNTGHLSIVNEENETDLIEQKSLPFRSIETPIKQFLSCSYKFVRLERTFKLANLLNNPTDQTKFEQDYRQALHDNKFDEFLQASYRKLQLHKKTIEQERIMKLSRRFTFADLEKNFLSLDPTRNIKIVFMDELTTPEMKDIHSTASTHQNSEIWNESNEATIEEFYKSRSKYFLQNRSRAYNEITSFARRTSERLHTHLPCLSQIPHRVRFIDQRHQEEYIDDRTLLQMKHIHNLSLISKRRQLIQQMFTQTKKNQNQMKQIDKRLSLSKDHRFSCRELLEQTNQIERTVKLFSKKY